VRRTIAALVLPSLLLVAACGSDTAEPAATTATASTTADAPVVTDGPSDTETDATFVDVGPPPTSPDKPTVQIPADLPTELGRTVLVGGTGPEAALGDTVIVDYIGVRSSDGTEFDNSYDRFEPFSVTLGSSPVIQGWQEGLIGTRAGDRIQLDIPGSLAYGDQPQGDVIGANEALTFVVDVRSVIRQSDPAAKPTGPDVPASEGAVDVITVDLVEGDGAELMSGQTAVIDFVLYRGDNLVELESNWGVEPLQIPMAETEFLAGLVRGMIGMKVGGRRAITIPPELAFGVEGNPSGGLPAETDIIVLVDLLGAY